MKKTVKSYSATFKAEAVKDIVNHGGNVSTTARKLGLPMQTLANWQKMSEQGKLEGTEQYDPHLMSMVVENKRLKRELKVACEEQDILNEEGQSEALLRPDARGELCSSGTRIQKGLGMKSPIQVLFDYDN